MRLANQHPLKPCLGFRPYDPSTKTFGPYEWMSYQIVRRRRANFGVGIMQLHKQVGIINEKYGVGLWSQNRPEWQITGRLYDIPECPHLPLLMTFIEILDACPKHYIQYLSMKRWGHQQLNSSSSMLSWHVWLPHSSIFQLFST